MISGNNSEIVKIGCFFCTLNVKMLFKKWEVSKRQHSSCVIS